MSRMLEDTLQSIGRYMLNGKIGSGQYGDVYRGYDPVLKRDVAIKIPSFDIQQHDLKKLLNTFQKEAELTASFLHPNIVAVYDVGSNLLNNKSGQDYWPHYLVMEYVEGTDLKTHLKQNGRLELKQALDVIYHCCMALDYIHYLGVTHRDIKPGNILVNWEKGIYKLTDFGISDTSKTRSGKSMGSLSYMSPEHFNSELSISHRSDIFALGCVMYELLTGRTAFTGSSPREVADKILCGSPESICDHCPDLPAELEQVLNRAIHKDQEKRYGDALTFARALREIDEKLFSNSVQRKEFSEEQVAQYLNLRDDSWFQHFTPDQITELLEVATSCDYQGGDYIIRENDEANEFYIIVSGKVSIEKNGERLTCLESGESFGEMGIRALRNRKRTADVKADTETNVLVVNIDRLELLSDTTRASLYRVFLEATMKRMSRMTNEVMELRKK